MVRELVRRVGTEREAFYHVGSLLVLYWNAPEVICLSSRNPGKLSRLFIQSLLAVYVNSMLSLETKTVLYWSHSVSIYWRTAFYIINCVIRNFCNMCVRTIATLKTTESSQTLAIALVAVVVILVGLKVTWEEWGVFVHQFRSWLSVNKLMDSKKIQLLSKPHLTCGSDSLLLIYYSGQTSCRLCGWVRAFFCAHAWFSLEPWGNFGNQSCYIQIGLHVWGCWHPLVN
jgi:hypothetical protein